MLSSRDSLIKLVQTLKDRSRMPANLEFSELGEYHLVNAYDELSAKVIHESVATGFDKDQNLAAIKSLVEFCERQAFVEGFKRNDPACRTERTEANSPLTIS